MVSPKLGGGRHPLNSFIASATIRAWAGSLEMSTLDLSRSRRPIGGGAGSMLSDAA